MEERRFKAAGYALFASMLGLLIVRIAAYWISYALSSSGMSDFVSETLLDTIFTVLIQIVVCFLSVFIIYKRTLKISTKQLFIESNFRKTYAWIYPLCAVIGILCFVATICVSSIWATVLQMFGYIYPDSSAVFPEVFSPWHLILSLVLSAVLPALCEEFVNRGLYLNVMRGVLSPMAFYVVTGLTFGLFHQNITQVFYASVFGAFMAYLTMRTGSIYPSMIIHFTNNAISVLLDFSQNYGWKLNDLWIGFTDLISSAGVFSIALCFAIAAGLIYMLVYLIAKRCRKDGEIIFARTFRPSASQSAFYIGAAVMAGLSTILTFFFNCI